MSFTTAFVTKSMMYSSAVCGAISTVDPYWSPSAEINEHEQDISGPQRQFIAESFFPDHPHASPSNQFFVNAARSIFARMLAFNPTPAELIRMLADDAMIDRCVEGTENAHLITKAAKAQRAGVLATLSEIGESLKLLPPPDEALIYTDSVPNLRETLSRAADKEMALDATKDNSREKKQERDDLTHNPLAPHNLPHAEHSLDQDTTRIEATQAEAAELAADAEEVELAAAALLL